MKGAKLIELARALQREIRSTSEDGFTAEQNGEISDMETTLQNFMETVEGKCAVDATTPTRIAGADVASQRQEFGSEARQRVYSCRRSCMLAPMFQRDP